MKNVPPLIINSDAYDLIDEKLTTILPFLKSLFHFFHC